MAKLQPNFSWQKYEGDEEDAEDQFQYQLQQQHIVTANAVNATIDDSSYFTKVRQTSFTWVDGQPIWTQTITGVIVGSAITPYPIKGTISTLVSIQGSAQDTVPMTSLGISIPYFDGSGNKLSVYVNPNQINLNAITSDYTGWTFYITIKFTQPRTQNA